MTPASAVRPKVFAFTNQKGGVGKTTFAFHLAKAAEDLSLRCLVIDLDTQANVTTALTGNYSLLKERGGSAQLFDDSPAPFATRSVSPYLALLHGHQYLDAVDSRYDVTDAVRLRSVLRSLRYDVIILDTAPGVSTRQIVAMICADQLFLPIEPAEFALGGLTQTLDSAKLVRSHNPDLALRILVNKYQKRSRSHTQRLRQLEDLGDLLAHPFFTLRTAISEALEAQLPVWRHKPAPRDLRALWRDFHYHLLSGCRPS
jgi:chromosome partitioning protein